MLRESGSRGWNSILHSPRDKTYILGEHEALKEDKRNKWKQYSKEKKKEREKVERKFKIKQ